MITIPRKLASAAVLAALTRSVGAERARRYMTSLRREFEADYLNARPSRPFSAITDQFDVKAVSLDSEGYVIEVSRRTDGRTDHFFLNLDGVVLRHPTGGLAFRRCRITGLAEYVRPVDPTAVAA